MSRTAHHVPPAHAARPERPGAPWHAVLLRDPRRGTRRSVAVFSLPRHQHDPTVARHSATGERRARARLRTALTTAVRLANTTPQDRDTLDIPPYRHRRSALWLA
ncbi:hypothetical protein ACF065_17135 [Streptomyces sp. NPDC015232]|uniref:hypothetical protein n=1 Tax=unclassified Streptomyces TaxID=2593676 RepID=UPI0036F9CA35